MPTAPPPGTRAALGPPGDPAFLLWHSRRLHAAGSRWVAWNLRGRARRPGLAFGAWQGPSLLGRVERPQTGLRVLVERGAAVAARNGAGETALDRARVGAKGRGVEWLAGSGG